jgi:acyl carrier protein
MEFDNHILKTPAAPEYVLNAFKDLYRHECEVNPEFVDGFELTFESTIKEWRYAYDLDMLTVKELGLALNKVFDIEFSKKKWKSLLEPWSKRTVGQLCSEIAKYTYQEKIRPLNILGKSCQKGGIFLALKSKLAQAGANVNELAPFSELAGYTRRYPQVFVDFSSKLFPNTIPPAKVSISFWNRLFIGSVLVGFLFMVAGYILHKYSITVGELFIVVGAFIFCVFYILQLCTLKIPPSSVKFGELKTFRDLVDFIANNATKNG